jgi:tight adherence protein B
VLFIVWSGIEPLQDLLRTQYGRAMSQAGVSLDAAALYTISSARLVQISLLASIGAFILVTVISGNFIVGILLAFLAYLMPRWWVRRQQDNRLQRLEEALPAALDQLMASVRAGLSLPQAIEEASRNTPSPICEEFAVISKEHRLGARLTDALTATQRRVGGRFVPLFTTALRISIDRGGNLPEALKRMSDAFREIWRLEQKMITASAEARKSMRVIGAMPIAIGLLVLVLQPDLLGVLTSSLAGWAVLAVAVLLYTTALAWLRRMLAAQA